MKKMILAAVLVSLAAFLTGCYEGYHGSEGAILKQYLEPAALKTLVDNPRPDIWIVDVRPAGSYKRGHIPTSKNFPSGDIMNRLGELPKTQYLILA